jgi:RNA polymerase sporulation-specific sigma factor
MNLRIGSHKLGKDNYVKILFAGGIFMALFKVEICGVNTSKLPLLSEERKKELFKEIKKGNMQAREEFIRGNLRLVLSILQRFSNSNENVDDLFQIGCIGLIKAVDNFDDTLNVKFSTYAVPMISGELKRFLRDNAAIRVSRSIKDIAYKAIYCKESIMKETNTEPTINEIAEYIGAKPEEVVYALDAIQSPVSLYDPVYDQGGDTLYVMDQISDKKNKEEKWVENIVLNEALNGLSKRERKIIDMRFFNGKTQMEIAEEIGISQAQVSRLEKNALKRMQNYMR